MGGDPLERAATLALTGRLDEAERLLDGGASDARATWIRAYLALSRGDFARAETLARSITLAGTRTAVHAMMTLASVLRHTDRHAEAEPWDRRALLEAGDGDDRAHAWIGLAADAVGQADGARASASLAEALRSAPGAGWRAGIRLRWVQAEVALLEGRHADAVTVAREALERSEAADARRHVAKSALFLGVALDAAGAPGAEALLLDAETRARSIGAEPVARIAAEIRERVAATRG